MRPSVRFELLRNRTQAPFFDYLRTKHEQYRFSLRQGFSTTQPFEPYRAPEPLSIEEGAMPYIEVMEVSATGRVALSDLPILGHDVCKAAIWWLQPKLGGISVRVGKPSIVPVQGQSAGSQVMTDIEAITFTATDYSCAEETDWFGAEPNIHWSSTSDARVSEADWIRLYSEKLDCCLAYEIKTRISATARATEEALRETALKGWTQSVFCLVPAWIEWQYPSIPEPDEKVVWPWDRRMLCGWYHWSILGGPVPIRTASELPFKFPDEEKAPK